MELYIKKTELDQQNEGRLSPFLFYDYNFNEMVLIDTNELQAVNSH